MPQPQGPQRSRTEARQGETHRGVRYVLVISTALAIMALALVGVWIIP